MTTRRPLIGLLAGSGLLLATGLRAHAQQPPNPPRFAPGFDLQGHRGARALFPENTLEGFVKTAEIGVSTLELDIAITRDGEAVITHDRTLNPDLTRGPDGQYIAAPVPVVQLSLEEVRRHDVGRIRPGTRYARDYPEQVPIDGARIPRLRDLFEMVKRSGNLSLRFAIETKLSPLVPQETVGPEVFVRTLLALIREYGFENRCSVLSFDWRTLRLLQQQAPEIPTVFLSIQQRNFDNIGADSATPSPWLAGFSVRDHGGSVPRTIRAAGGHTWSVFHRDLTPEKVREAQSLGLKVLAWTVNDPARMGELIDWRLDGLVTDRPDLARAEMARRGIPLPDPVRLAL